MVTSQPRLASVQSLDQIENDPGHHLAGPFLPQTPLGSLTPQRTASPGNVTTPSYSLWSDLKTFRWAVRPSSAFKLLIIPVILYANWEVLGPFLHPDLPNPFAGFMFISHYLPDSPPESPLYRKGYLDLLFLGYHIIFFSFFRQIVTIKLARPIARSYGIKREAKLERFGEQAYAFVYFTIMGAWGARIMSQLPTWWYHTEYFWSLYPQWKLTPELKRYYLMHSAYWCQQLIVLVMGLEKPRKDYWELVAHHFVTLWMVGWSYLMNLTFIGNAVFMSMDIPDFFLAFSKMLNYIQFERAKVVSFATFVVVWTYFRHWLNFAILWSVWNEFKLIPEGFSVWNPAEGLWMPWWLRHQMFFWLGTLQALNVFWYFLIMRVLARSIMTSETTDERSDDEDDGDDDPADSKED